MEFPEDLLYSSDHEWVRREDAGLRIGITDYAQDALGDVVFVDLPEVGRVVATGESVSEVESTKSVSDIYAPIPGTIVEVNESLNDGPELLNSDPYGNGWIFRIDTDDNVDGAGLMDAAAYRELVEG